MPDTGTRPPEQTDTPVQELRAAAAKLRETAAKATPGPWDVSDDLTIALGIEQHSPGSYSYDVELACVAPDVDRALDASHNPDIKVGTAKADAEWIALANPAIAGPLATLLEAEANREVYTLAEFGHRTIGDDVLAVARAINGTKP